MSESLPIGEEKILARYKAELCMRKIDENSSFFDASLHDSQKNYFPQEFISYFSKNNTYDNHISEIEELINTYL